MDPIAAGLLVDICAHPEDDTPRLIYADWLEEQGEAARAELIRLQIERSHLDENDPRFMTILTRESQLRSEYELRWRRAMPKIEGIGWLEFNRGFIESLSARRGTVFADAAAEIFATAPIRSLRVEQFDLRGARALLAAGVLPRLRELNLGGNITVGPGLKLLVSHPDVERLTSLLLHYCRMRDDVLMLKGAVHLRGLRELYLSGNELNDDLVTELFVAPPSSQLRELDLRDNQIQDGGAAALAASADLGELRTLWLVNNRIGGAGARALAESPRMPQLKYLYLNHNPIGNEGAIALASSALVEGVRELDLRVCGITDEGGQALLATPRLAGVRTLLLSGNSLSSMVMRQLRERYGKRLPL